MSEEIKNGENECRGTKCSKRKVWFLVAVVVLLAAAVTYAVIDHANKVRIEEERIAAEKAAEKARIEAIMKKPLLEWTDADKAELPEFYETRRQRERVTNSALWTEEEKQTERWAYTKLVTGETYEKVKESVVDTATKIKDGTVEFAGKVIDGIAKVACEIEEFFSNI